MAAGEQKHGNEGTKHRASSKNKQPLGASQAKEGEKKPDDHPGKAGKDADNPCKNGVLLFHSPAFRFNPIPQIFHKKRPFCTLFAEIYMFANCRGGMVAAPTERCIRPTICYPTYLRPVKGATNVP